MLGKTANGLFWMYRYLERAENTARLIETGQRIALTRLGEGDDDEWRSVLQAAGVLDGFEASGEEISKEAAIDWLLRSRDNPSSVLSCVENARQNARLVRTGITGEVWEAMNASYMDIRGNLARKVAERDLPKALGRIRQRAALVRGTTQGTMLRNEVYNFARIGTFLERADNTARILDVKYYVLLPSAKAVGSSLDNVQWETILRSVSGRGGFRTEYGNAGGPMEIIDFLILNMRMPRSLAFCTAKMGENLQHLNAGEDDLSPSLQKVAEIQQDCLSYDVEAIIDHGLHEFIQKMLGHFGGLAWQIEKDYRFNE